MCMFPDEMESKRVGLGSPDVDTMVPGDTQCRACSMVGDTEPVNALQRTLLAHQCITGSADCRYGTCACYKFPLRRKGDTKA